MMVVFIIACIPLALLLSYPFYAWLRYVFFKSPPKRNHLFLQPVSILISCYNEEKHIRQRIETFLADDEWIDGSEIIVISAGSTDGTNAILESFHLNSKVKTIILQQHFTKIESLNKIVPLASNNILIFSDCRQQMRRHAVKHLVRNFSDPRVGTVTSVLRDHFDSKQESFMRKLLNAILYMDGQSGSSLNVYGALYAQRKSCFRPFPKDILFDDLFVIVSTLQQKKRLVQENRSVIYDVNFGDYYANERIKRLNRGLLLFFVNHWRMVFKLEFNDLVRFMIYKYAKLLMPVCMLVSFISFLFVAPAALVSITLSLFLFFALLIPSTQRFIHLLLRINYYFLLSSFRFFFLGDRSVTWAKLKTST
ncbi:MAG TPA: glycosyltransferase [Flavobacteriales bacterium]|nr:glycosyltransferase [Flavobacteriales bacterium]